MLLRAFKTRGYLPARRKISTGSGCNRTKHKFENTVPGMAVNLTQNGAEGVAQLAAVLGIVAIAGGAGAISATSSGAKDAANAVKNEGEKWVEDPNKRASEVFDGAQANAIQVTSGFVHDAGTTFNEVVSNTKRSINSVQSGVQTSISSTASTVDEVAKQAAAAPRSALGSLATAADGAKTNTSGFFGRISDTLGNIGESLKQIDHAMKGKGKKPKGNSESHPRSLSLISSLDSMRWKSSSLEENIRIEQLLRNAWSKHVDG